MIIRTVEPDDFGRWLPLWDGYNAFYGRAGATALDRALTDVTWRRFLDGTEPVDALVAEEGGVLIGLAHYIFHRNTIMINDTCYLQDLFTAPDARGKGIGKALVETVYDRAHAKGCPRVYWHTHESNGTARRLYDLIGSNKGFIVYRKDLP